MLPPFGQAGITRQAAVNQALTRAAVPGWMAAGWPKDEQGFQDTRHLVRRKKPIPEESRLCGPHMRDLPQGRPSPFREL